MALPGFCFCLDLDFVAWLEGFCFHGWIKCEMYKRFVGFEEK